MPPPTATTVRRLVERCGWNTTCFQILNQGMDQWVSTEGSAAVGFVRRADVRVVAGAPVCDESDLPRTLDDWERSEPGPVCYFGAEGRLHRQLSGRSSHSTVVMGAQPVWSPESWAGAVHASASLRYQLHRAANKGVTVEEWPAERVRHHPGLRRCLDHWLRTRGLPTLHFLVEPEILSEPDGRRVFVMLREGAPVGFVAMAPVPARNGWLTEMFVRGPGAPNGTVELGLTTAVSSVGASGAEFVTMGMVPLSPHAQSEMDSNPPWLRFVSSWSRAHLRRFYDFDGLDTFKSKFQPDRWEPIWVITNEPRFRVRSLYAVTAAFTRSNPVVTLAKGLAKAAATEGRWVWARLTSSR